MLAVDTALDHVLYVLLNELKLVYITVRTH
jgi:hypothetical protein